MRLVGLTVGVWVGLTVGVWVGMTVGVWVGFTEALCAGVTDDVLELHPVMAAAVTAAAAAIP